MKTYFALVLVCSIAGLNGEDDYENKLTKLWSLSSASSVDGSAVLNVTSASIVISPNSYSNEGSLRKSRDSKMPYVYKKYAFRPRAIPLTVEAEERKEYDQNKYKSDVLFPGNYFAIANEKSENESDGEEAPFQPKPIPLMRGEELQRRSLGEVEEPIIERPQGFTEAVASRRSISDILGVGEDDDFETTEEEEEEEYDEKGPHGIKNKRKGLKKGAKKLTRYMLPLLLAYKLKYFALVPLLLGGLVLLVGATGMAGFFFALFAAVMGLQKGGY